MGFHSRPIDELNDIGNVVIAAIADGHFISWSAGLGYWQNRLLAEADIPDGVKIATGSYVGNGAAGRQITTGFKCSCVIIQSPWFQSRYILIPNKTIRDYNSVDNTADTCALHASDGFVIESVGDSNRNGETFYYWAISE